MKDPTHRSFGEQARHYFTRTHTGLPKAPIDSPAAWLGKGMRERESSWHLRLDDAELAEFDEGLSQLEDDGVAIEEVGRAPRFPRPAFGSGQVPPELIQ